MLLEANEYLLAHKDDDNNTPPSSGNSKDNEASKEDTNKGTLTLDAIIYHFCKSYGIPLLRCYRKRARKDYLVFAKSKKHSTEKIRKALPRQLGYVARDIGYLKKFMSDGIVSIS